MENFDFNPVKKAKDVKDIEDAVKKSQHCRDRLIIRPEMA